MFSMMVGSVRLTLNWKCFSLAENFWKVWMLWFDDFCCWNFYLKLHILFQMLLNYLIGAIRICQFLCFGIVCCFVVAKFGIDGIWSDWSLFVRRHICFVFWALAFFGIFMSTLHSHCLILKSIWLLFWLILLIDISN